MRPSLAYIRGRFFSLTRARCHRQPWRPPRRAPLPAHSRSCPTLRTSSLGSTRALALACRPAPPLARWNCSSRRPPPLGAAEPPRRPFLRPVRALKPSLGGPQAILRPLRDDRSRRPRRIPASGADHLPEDPIVRPQVFLRANLQTDGTSVRNRNCPGT
jgi:hypothetical protein